MNRRRVSHSCSIFAWLAWTILLGMLPATAYAAARVEVQKLLDTAALGEPFVFDVNPVGAVLVLTRDNVYDAGARKFLFGEPLNSPAWLAFSGTKLHLVAGGALFVVDGEKPRQLLEVPLKQRIFVGDDKRTFISGVTSAGNPVLYIYKEGAGYKPLLELDAPIDAMALARGTLFFAAGTRIFSLRDGGPVKLLAQLPGFKHIPSLAVDDQNGVLYFSEGDHLYAVSGNDFVVVRRNIGGMLRWRNNSLYILSWRDHLLLRLSGLPEALVAGPLVQLADPCRPPVLSLYCAADEKRTLLKAVTRYAGSLAPEDAAARSDLGIYATEQLKALAQIEAALEKEATTGVQAVRWGGGHEPQALRAKEAVITKGNGVGLNLWDGSAIRVGPDSKLVIDDCRAERECRLTLVKGLLYFEPDKPPLAEVTAPTAREYKITTQAMTLRSGAARFVLYATGGETYVVVLEGRIKGVTPEGDAVSVATGETLEVRRGKRPGAPQQAEMDRVKKWWEEIR